MLTHLQELPNETETETLDRDSYLAVTVMLDRTHIPRPCTSFQRPSPELSGSSVGGWVRRQQDFQSSIPAPSKTRRGFRSHRPPHDWGPVVSFLPDLSSYLTYFFVSLLFLRHTAKRRARLQSLVPCLVFQDINRVGYGLLEVHLRPSAGSCLSRDDEQLLKALL